MSLRLSHKIILLVLTPVVVELAFLGTLFVLVEQFNQEFQKEVRGRKFVDSLNDIHTCIGKGSDAVMRYMRTYDPQEISVYRNYVSRGGQQIYALEKMLESGDSYQQSRISAIEKLIAKAKIATDDFLKAVETGAPQRLVWGILAKSAADKVLLELNSINREEQDRLNRRLASVEKRRQDLELVLLLGASINVLVAGVAASLAAGSLTRRIKKLMENSRRIGANQALVDKLSGTDELAELDDALRRMEKALSETMRKQRAIVENVSEVICSIDESHRFMEINEASQSTWGYNSKDLQGRRLISIVREEDHEETLHAMSEAREGHLIALENGIIKSDGSIADMSWSLRWVQEENSYFAVAHDISERKELERLKREFVSIVSHDLRSPLSSLSVKLELLGRGASGPLPQAAIAEIATAQTNIKQLISLTRDLLDLERLETGKWQMQFKKRSLLGILDDAVQSIQGICDLRNIAVVLPENDVQIEADGNRLVQVVINILSNSLKYAPEGEPIDITIKREMGLVEVRITDTGPGIPIDEQSVVFERFRQAGQYGSKTTGFGLGLSICSQIIHAHNGSIGVESRPGKGCTFWFRLPEVQPA
ncbi:MAG: PAS domain S-box protein [Cyanobacteria bacterium SZAS TMP-1]|nr:PAS domain S-box protein [Cyanobacteria bacterium SZAS TMP-1]